MLLDTRVAVRAANSWDDRSRIGCDDQGLHPAPGGGDCLTKLARWVAAFSVCALVLGCSTRVEYFVDQAYPPRAMDTPTEWLIAEPSKPHIELAQITVSSTILSEGTLRQQILDRAHALGADAVVEGKPVVVISMAPTPYYEPGILGPKGASFGLYGYGWYTPYSPNPYFLVQGAVDQPRVDKYISGVAIRYQEEMATNAYLPEAYGKD